MNLTLPLQPLNDDHVGILRALLTRQPTIHAIYWAALNNFGYNQPTVVVEYATAPDRACEADVMATVYRGMQVGVFSCMAGDSSSARVRSVGQLVAQRPDAE